MRAERRRRGRAAAATAPAAVLLAALTGTALLIPPGAGTDVRAATAASAPAVVRVGTLDDARLAEVSGLAVSQRRRDVLWAVNDSGNPAELLALSTDGSVLGAVQVDGARNVDWEDLAAWTQDGRAFLVIADIGDNGARRRRCSLWIVPEPDPAALPARVEPARVIHFRYPDGPRDAEGLAIDAAGGRALVVSKRTRPPVLYAVPLGVGDASGAVLTAQRLGEIGGIPAPTALELAADPVTGIYASQPTALDYREGLGLLVLTYARPYLFPIPVGESLEDHLGDAPLAVAMPRLLQAEAAALDGSDLLVTSEQLPAPLLRIDLARSLPTSRP